MKSMTVTLLLVAGGAWSVCRAQQTRWTITVCLNPVGLATQIYRAEATASQILKDARVRISWRGDVRVCSAPGSGILITVSDHTPSERKPGALASAQPYERTHVFLFYDRIIGSVKPDAVPTLLGHVLAHEIVHMLQGVAVHMQEGLMKAQWDHRDFVEMQRRPYRLTELDIGMIHSGLAKSPWGGPVQ
jgi:hypothetical protein